MSIPFHQLANLFPLIEGDAFAELVEDIRAYGVREKIKILDGQILDGRNRYRAAIAAGVLDETDDYRYPGIGEGTGSIKPPFAAFVPQIDGDPLAWVLSKNLYRRHMTESQLAMSGAELATMRQGERTDLPSIEGKSEEAPQYSQKQAAELMQVSVTSVERAAVVRKHGVEGLADRVKQGEMAVSVAEQIARLPVSEQLNILRGADPKAFGRVARERRSVIQAEKKERRIEREADLGARQVAMPTKRFGVILADPEWQFEPYSRETGMDRAADNHYPTSSTDLIASRAVASIAADDAVLLLWVTVPMLLQGIAVMQAWGFTYKSHAVWIKDRVGTGYWFRNQHELLLLGTRGNIPAPAMGDQFRSALSHDVAEHSTKPPFAHEIAEAYFPSLPKIEMNARRARPGWTAWGLEARDDVSSIDGGDCDPANWEDGADGVSGPIEIPEAMTLSGAPAGVSPAYSDACVPSSGESTPFIFDAKADRAIRVGFNAGRPRGVIAAEIGCLKTEVSERAQALGVVHKSRAKA